MENEFVYSEVDYNFIYSEVDVPTNGSLFITASDNNSNNYKWGYTSQDIIVPITDSTGTYYESGTEHIYINPGEVIEYKNSENTIYIIPSLVKIHPNLIINTGTKKTLQQNEAYRFSATNNFKLYYL
jgi:signal peptidase I